MNTADELILKERLAAYEVARKYVAENPNPCGIALKVMGDLWQRCIDADKRLHNAEAAWPIGPRCDLWK